MNAKKPNHRATSADADMEPNPRDAAFRADEAPYFTTPVCIHFHHIRKRLADVDGLSIKAVLDGLVAANVLADDKAECVAEIRNTQAKGEPERTIVTITEVEA